jgi:hypothetical protein
MSPSSITTSPTSEPLPKADPEAPASSAAPTADAVAEPAAVPDPKELARDSESFAAAAYAEVAGAYLDFRRKILHEDRPSLKDQPGLTTNPPASLHVERSELAILADNTLRLLPQAVKSAPILGGLLEHLEQVADMHSLTAAKCIMLNNMTMALLYGVTDGLQSWYVEWALASAHHLSQVDTDGYFFAFPWDACLYKSESELALFDNAVRSGDTGEIKRQVAQIGDRLITALRDPVQTQTQFAFTGAESEWRKMVFHLKTSAALMLAGYLVTDEARALLHPRQVKLAPTSVLAPLPPALSSRLVAATSA